MRSSKRYGRPSSSRSSCSGPNTTCSIASFASSRLLTASISASLAPASQYLRSVATASGRIPKSAAAASALCATGSITPGFSSTVTQNVSSVDCRDRLSRILRRRGRSPARSTTASASSSLASRSICSRLQRRALHQISARRGDVTDSSARPSSRAAAATRSPARSGCPSAGWMSISQSITIPFPFCRRFQNRNASSRRRLVPTFSQHCRQLRSNRSSASSTCCRLAAKIGCHNFGSPPATRVVSRQPLAVKGSNSAGVAAASAAATRCGKWLVIASAASCSAGVIVVHIRAQALPKAADFRHRRRPRLIASA